MEKKKTLKRKERIALQLPSDLNDYFTRIAADKLTSKSAIIRSVLADYVRSQQPA